MFQICGCKPQIERIISTWPGMGGGACALVPGSRTKNEEQRTRDGTRNEERRTEQRTAVDGLTNFRDSSKVELNVASSTSRLSGGFGGLFGCSTFVVPWFLVTSFFVPFFVLRSLFFVLCSLFPEASTSPRLVSLVARHQTGEGSPLPILDSRRPGSPWRQRAGLVRRVGRTVRR